MYDVVSIVWDCDQNDNWFAIRTPIATVDSLQAAQQVIDQYRKDRPHLTNELEVVPHAD